MRVLMSGKAGEGRVTETAGVRGIDESDLKSASFDAAQLKAMNAQRVDGSAAVGYAGEHGWQATTVAYANEAKGGRMAERRRKIRVLEGRQERWAAYSAR